MSKKNRAGKTPQGAKNTPPAAALAPTPDDTQRAAETAAASITTALQRLHTLDGQARLLVAEPTTTKAAAARLGLLQSVQKALAPVLTLAAESEARVLAVAALQRNGELMNEIERVRANRAAKTDAPDNEALIRERDELRRKASNFEQRSKDSQAATASLRTELEQVHEQNDRLTRARAVAVAELDAARARIAPLVDQSRTVDRLREFARGMGKTIRRHTSLPSTPLGDATLMKHLAAMPSATLNEIVRKTFGAVLALGNGAILRATVVKGIDQNNNPLEELLTLGEPDAPADASPAPAPEGIRPAVLLVPIPEAPDKYPRATAARLDARVDPADAESLAAYATAEGLSTSQALAQAWRYLDTARKINAAIGRVPGGSAVDPTPVSHVDPPQASA